MIKVLELFGGIGACSRALEKNGIEFEIVDYVEIDKYAVKSFNAIHNTNFEPQDIVKWNKKIDVDLIMHGSPCQDFSVAGKQAGGDEGTGTRSSLMYETIRIVENLKPKYVLWENVKNLLSAKHKHNFDAYIERMNQLGYNSYYKVLNAKDYEIPQNRERVFTISIKRDIDKGTFVFPEKKELKLRLKDLLENEVDKKYYLSNEKINSIANWKAYQKPFEKVLGKNSIVPTLTARGAGEEHSGMITYSENLEYTTNLQEQCLKIQNNTRIKEFGYIEKGTGKHQSNTIYDIEGLPRTICASDCSTPMLIKQQLCDNLEHSGLLKENYVIEHSYQKENLTDYIKNKNGIVPTLTTRPDCLEITEKKENLIVIRKLTPKECWRLMGFDDEDFEKAEKVNTNSQLYKQAGNSIVVNVLQAILKELFKNE